MKRLPLLTLLRLILALAFVGPSTIALAQEETTSTETQAEGDQPVSRAERLRLHEERVRRIIEERRKARTASDDVEEPAEPAQAEQSVSSPNDFGNMILYNVFRVEEGSAIITGGRNNSTTRQRPTQDASNVQMINNRAETSFDGENTSAVLNRLSSNDEGPASTANGYNPASGQSGMLSLGDKENKKFDYALDTIIRRGDRFVSEVRLQNSQAKEFDRIRIALQYDKRFLRPVKVYDQAIRNSIKGEPKFEIDDRDSLLVYEGEFKTTRLTKELVLLTIVWEAILTTEHTELNFAFAGAETEERPHTGIYYQGDNILGERADPFDGVLGGSILILKPFDINGEDKGDITQGKKQELREIYLSNVGGQRPVGLELIGPDFAPAVGETFQVDVALNNPGGSVVDAVKFFILFDPKVIQVVDQDLGNWIRRGVNIHDGPYRLKFPFDYHKYNEADNKLGRIRYAKSIGSTITLPSGTFATIHFRALAPTNETSIAFVATQGTTERVTDLQILGYSVFSQDPKLTTPEVLLQVLPEQVAGTTKTEVASSAEKEYTAPPYNSTLSLIDQLLELP